MGDKGFPGLGFNPTKGEPSAVDATLDALHRAKQTFNDVKEPFGGALARAQEWKGEASSRFAEKGDKLAGSIWSGVDALGTVCTVLEAWRRALTKNKAKAEQYERRARQLLKEVEQLEEKVGPGGVLNMPGGIGPEADRARAEFAAAKGALDDANAALEAVREKARQLKADHERRATQAAASLQSTFLMPSKHASFDPGDLPGEGTIALAKFLGDVSKWTGRIAVATRSPYAKAASSLTGAASFAAYENARGHLPSDAPSTIANQLPSTKANFAKLANLLLSNRAALQQLQGAPITRGKRTTFDLGSGTAVDVFEKLTGKELPDGVKDLRDIAGASGSKGSLGAQGLSTAGAIDDRGQQADRTKRDTDALDEFMRKLERWQHEHNAGRQR